MLLRFLLHIAAVVVAILAGVVVGSTGSNHSCDSMIAVVVISHDCHDSSVAKYQLLLWWQ
jgi:hypothetical protein